MKKLFAGLALALASTIACAQITLTINGVTYPFATIAITTGATPPSAVNGVCGASNGGTFSTAPTTGLCNAGSPTTVSSTGPTTWGWQCIGSGGGTTASCTANLASPSVGCGPGEVMGPADQVWIPMYATNLFPVPAATGSGTLGRAIQFKADNVTYPNGIILNGYDQAPVASAKQTVISACPHNYTPVASYCNRNSATPFFQLSFGGPNVTGYDCMLQAGGTYYINFRDYYGNGANVSAQFGVSLR